MKVSVIVVTYNHERFIDHALASVMAQETGFEFEVIVSEDCSTDATRQIVVGWKNRYPNRIRLLLSDRNIRSNEVVARGFREAKGQYVALLDGDDLWTSRRKLHTQASFLDRFPEYVMCFHNVAVVDATGNAVVGANLWTPQDQKVRSTLEDIWFGNFIATCSTMFRNGVVEIPAYYADMFPVTDWPLYVLFAEHGDIGYIPDVMGAYRLHDGGLYSSLPAARKLDLTHRFYESMNANMGFRHDALVRRAHRTFFLDWAREHLSRGDRQLSRLCFRRSLALGLPGSIGAAAETLKLGLAIHSPIQRCRRPQDGGIPNDHIPPIATVEPATPRPRWSVMIPTYNCAGYLEEALASVLSQAPPPEAMQIEVVDDASTDDPRAVIDRLSAGRVEFFRQPSNVGVPANLTTCIRRARGELVHILHGDDAIRPGFYAAMEFAFAQRPDLGAAFCRHIFMDAQGHRKAVSPLERQTSGILDDAAAYLAAEQRIMTPSICVRRAVYESLGGFHESLRCAEDWEMWVRVAASYPVWYEPQPLALYRMHDVSNTGRHLRTGEDIAYTARAIELIARHLPPGIASSVSARARKTYARSALLIAQQAFARGDISTGRAQFLGAFSLNPSARTLAAAAATLARAAKAWLLARDAFPRA